MLRQFTSLFSLVLFFSNSLHAAQAVCYQEEEDIPIYGDYIKEFQLVCEYSPTSYYYTSSHEMDLVKFIASNRKDQLLSRSGWTSDKYSSSCAGDKYVTGRSVYVNRPSSGSWLDNWYVQYEGHTYNTRDTNVREIIRIERRLVWKCPNRATGLHN